MSKKASYWCQIFHAKLDHAKSLIIYRWLKAQGLRYWIGANESQCSLAEAASDVLDFMRDEEKSK